MTADFDEIVHAPLRLRICAALDTATGLEFAVLEEALGISTSALSKHLRVLTDAGYVELEKRRQVVGRPRTFARLTPEGRRRYRGHVAALRRIVAGEPG